jgi:hypothetical protein
MATQIRVPCVERIRSGWLALRVLIQTSVVTKSVASRKDAGGRKEEVESFLCDLQRLCVRLIFFVFRSPLYALL